MAKCPKYFIHQNPDGTWDVLDEMEMAVNTQGELKTRTQAIAFKLNCEEAWYAEEANDRYWGSMYEAAGDRSDVG